MTAAVRCPICKSEAAEIDRRLFDGVADVGQGESIRNDDAPDQFGAAVARTGTVLRPRAAPAICSQV